MKKMFFAMIMTLVLGSVVNTATAEMPFPTCYPCDNVAVSSK